MLSVAHEALGAELFTARRDRVPVAPLTERQAGLSVGDAYRVQEAFVARLVADGDEVRGWKLGLTSRAMQQLLGVDSPDYGRVPGGFLVADGGSVAAADFIAPRIEAEIALRVGADLAGPRCTVEDVAAAVEAYVPALEIVDSRIADWRITLADTVADLASMGAVVLSDRAVPPGDWDERLVEAVLRRDGEVVSTGAGAAALGGPMRAVAWLVETLHPLGARLEAGQFVMTGALHAAVPVAAGQTYEAAFDRLGTVSVSIT